MPFRGEPVDGFGNTVDILAHTKLFLSSNQTGTGAGQNIPHGLGATPTVVYAFVNGDARVGWAAYTLVEGAHDATNVVMTVTTDVKYRVVAMV